MADLMIKPEAGSGNKLILQDQAGNAVLTTADSGASLNNVTGVGPPEGTAVLSTGETGGTKYLREDGDGTSSWQSVASGGGFIKSVTTDTETTQLYMNGNGGSYHDVNLEVTVTPQSAASKFLIFVQLNAKSSNVVNSSIVNVILQRNGSTISNAQGSRYVQTSNVFFFSYVPFYIGCPDSPATASAVTYKVQGKAEDGTVIWNISGIQSHLIVMEY